MAAAGAMLEPSLLSQFGVTSTGSQVLIAAPLSSGVSLFDAFPDASSNSAAYRSLIGLDRFTSDARFADIDGRGFSSVILDTGIDLDHPFFGPDADANGVADRIVYQYDFADSDADASDRNGHGSNVSSIVGSSSDLYPGIAPGSSIIALKVFTDGGSGNFASIERALQWVVANVSRFNIASVNLSLGDSGNYTAQQARYGIGDELAALAALKVITVAAAGNSFYELGSVQGVSYPAADPGVLAAGAVYSTGSSGFAYGSGAKANTTGAGRLAPFSQRSTSIQTIFAPGAPITGASAFGGTISMHGTSQASPVLAGVATLAQNLASSVLHRRLSMSEFRALLSATSATILDGDDEDDNVTNTGATFRRVDVLALGQAILNLAPPPGGGASGGGSQAQPPAAPARPNRAPTLTSVRTLTGAVAGQPALLTYDMLAAAANERDPDGDAVRFTIMSVNTARGTLYKNGAPVSVGSTQLAPGESLTYVPGSKAGTVAAFTIVVGDGQLASRSRVNVNISVARPTKSFSQSTLRPRSDAVADGVLLTTPLATSRPLSPVISAPAALTNLRSSAPAGISLGAQVLSSGLLLSAPAMAQNYIT